MRVALEIVSGPERGRTVRLAARETRQFGRTDWADTSFPFDNQMSQVHFSLETDTKLCRIRDLDSSNGTQVNGELIAEHVLADGDRITAGGTTFLVKIEGGADASVVVQAKTSAAAAAAKAPPRKKINAKFTVETCNSGVTLYRGEAAELSPAHLIDLISRKLPLYLLLDFHKIPDGAPADLPPTKYLFDWMPPEVAAATSPVVLPAADYAEYFSLIEKAWGEDALVAIYSKTDPADLRAHLSKQAQVGKDGVLGYCWPGVFATLLQFHKKELVNRLLAGIDAVVVEFPDFPDTWQVFASAEFQATLESLGLQPEQPESAAVGENSSNSKQK